MIVRCSKCNKKYERFDIGSYGYPYVCKKCNTFSLSLLMVLVFLCVLLIPLTSAQIQTLGNFKQSDCVNLKQVCSNCSYVNITSIIYPNSTQANGEVAMTKVGTDYNYTFCKTTNLGTYIVNGKGDLNGVDNVWSYDFNITGNGKELPNGSVIVLFILFFLLILGLLTYMAIYSTGHFIKMDFDIIDLAYNLGVYFMLFGLYMVSQYYLGNPIIEDFLLLLVQVGALTNVLMPFMALIVSIFVGAYNKKKFDLGKPLANPIGMRYLRGGSMR